MTREVEFEINVTNAARLGEAARMALTVTLPDPADLPARPVVCFAKPGGGYSRRYFTCDLPGPGRGAQASWHAARGVIFVSVDLLGVGDSSLHAPEKLGFTAVSAASFAAEQDILLRLANGTVAADFPPVHRPLTIGLGQSMGGSITIVQQARHHCYDGLAILGYSPIHTHPPTPPGEPSVVVPWVSRDGLSEAPFVTLNEQAVAAALASGVGGGLWRALLWGFHYDDVSQDIVGLDLAHFDRTSLASDEVLELPPWSSLTEPGAVTQSTLTPSIVATEAAAVTVPVLCAMGERDMVVDPPGEPRAYRMSRSVDLFICPRMGHMHNFAGTRALLWQRIQSFIHWCGAMAEA